VVEGKGQLGTFRFGGADMYARKSVADPDFASHSWVHHFESDGAWVPFPNPSYLATNFISRAGTKKN